MVTNQCVDCWKKLTVQTGVLLTAKLIVSHGMTISWELVKHNKLFTVL